MKAPTSIVCLREHHFYAGLLRENPVILDLGANRGEFSQLVRDIFGAKSHAIEAMPDLYRQISEIKGINVHNYALAAQDGPVVFYMSDNIEAGSIVNKQGRPVEVPGISLQSLMDKLGIMRDGEIDLMKIDIEGAEIDVLETSPPELLRRFSQITVEFHDFLEEYQLGEKVEQVKRRMEQIGFYCIVFSGRSNFDVLFVRKGQKNFGFLHYLYYKTVYKYTKGLIRVLKRTLKVGK